jgi:hypothetical protein
MDYTELVKRSVSNAWRYKFLWVFGFFVSVADGFGGGHWWTEKLDRSEYVFPLGDSGVLRIDPAILIFLALGAFALGVVFWVMSVLSEGSLIHGVSRKEFNLKVSFSDCWSVGLGKFLRLFVIMLLATLTVVCFILCLAVVLIPSYLAALGLGIALTILALPIFLAAVIVVVCVEGWAMRFAVFGDQGWLDAIARGWHLFRDNLGRTLAVAFLSFTVQLVLGCFVVVGMLILAIPLVLIIGLPLGLLVFILSSAFFGTFASSMWTLGFVQMTGYSVPQASGLVNEVPPAPESGQSSTV